MLPKQGVGDDQLKGLRQLDQKLTAQEKFNEQIKTGASLMEQYQSPLEKYRATMKDLEDLSALGAIDAKTFKRASAGAFDELSKTLGGGEVKLAGAADRGSADAVSALNRASVQSRTDPQQVMQKLIEQELAETKRQTALLATIARSTGGNNGDGFNLT